MAYEKILTAGFNDLKLELVRVLEIQDEELAALRDEVEELRRSCSPQAPREAAGKGGGTPAGEGGPAPQGAPQEDGDVS